MIRIHATSIQCLPSPPPRAQHGVDRHRRDALARHRQQLALRQPAERVLHRALRQAGRLGDVEQRDLRSSARRRRASAATGTGRRETPTAADRGRRDRGISVSTMYGSSGSVIGSSLATVAIVDDARLAAKPDCRIDRCAPAIERDGCGRRRATGAGGADDQRHQVRERAGAGSGQGAGVLHRRSSDSRS